MFGLFVLFWKHGELKKANLVRIVENFAPALSLALTAGARVNINFVGSTGSTGLPGELEKIFRRNFEFRLRLSELDFNVQKKTTQR